MVKVSAARRQAEKRAIIIARLVPTPEAYKGKTNDDVAREILSKAPAIPYVAEIERVSVFNSLVGAEEADESKGQVAEAFKPVHQALTQALQRLGEHGIIAHTIFNAAHGILVVTLEKSAGKG